MTKTKFQKRKDRERKSRNKVLKQRSALRTKAKEIRENDRQEREAQRTVNRLTGFTVMNDKEKLSEDEVMDCLDNNMEILKALQAEFEAQEELKKNPPQQGLGASADVQFIPKEN